MINTELEQEKSKLASTIEFIKSKKNSLESMLTSMGAITLEKLIELRRDAEGGRDLIVALQRLNESNASFNLPDKYAQLEELVYLEKEPYFARIDLKDAAVVNSYYIGKFGITDNEVPLVTDWRTKIASIFYKYRYPQKNVTYKTDSQSFTYDLTLKRTYEIDEGELVKFYNNDLQFDDSSQISRKIEGRTGGILEDIIETIQEGQLEIIESDPRQTCIVQGCVGSGKSTVAIHKLAHIFFNFPDLIHANRSILIARNQILVSYLSTLFPKLGIFDINYKTVKDLLIQFLYKEGLKVKFNFDLPSDLTTYSPDYIAKIRKEIAKMHIYAQERLESIFTDGKLSSFGGFVYSSKNPVFANVSELEGELNEEIILQKELIKETDNTLKKEMHKENIKSLKKIMSSVSRVKHTLGIEYKKLLKTYGLDEDKILSYDQTMLFVVIYTEVYGFEKFMKFEYCVVDEGQDFSILEYLVLNKFVLFGRFCILGDLNQSYEKAGLTTWEDIQNAITEARNAKLFELTTNYRSTKEIIDFANTILSPFTSSYLPIPIDRHGAVPNMKSYSNYSELINHLIEEVKADLVSLTKSIGVIVYDEVLYNAVDEALSSLLQDNDHFIKLDADKQIRYIPKGVYLTKFEDVKGLEFSKIYILGLKLGDIKTFKDAKSAFVAVTRAMNEVLILGTN
jgi:DNA helicase-2/ATP-dependent DNA helicase PcrA